MIRVTFCIHKSRIKGCYKILNDCHGKIMPCDSNKYEKKEFESHEAEFENLNDANAFIYKNYNSFGLYFYVVSMS